MQVYRRKAITMRHFQWEKMATPLDPPPRLDPNVTVVRMAITLIWTLLSTARLLQRKLQAIDPPWNVVKSGKNEGSANPWKFFWAW